MASWNEILDKFGQMPSPYDAVRREYISRLSTYTGRNTILYYSAWLQKSLMANGSFDFGINDNDKTGFMTCIYKMDKKKGLESHFAYSWWRHLCNRIACRLSEKYLWE